MTLCRAGGLAFYSAVLLTISSCATITPIHDYCQLAKPILLAKGEAATLSDESAKEILAHNLTYQKVCR
jgi:hypothetical protein